MNTFRISIPRHMDRELGKTFPTDATVIDVYHEGDRSFIELETNESTYAVENYFIHMLGKDVKVMLIHRGGIMKRRPSRRLRVREEVPLGTPEHVESDIFRPENFPGSRMAAMSLVDIIWQNVGYVGSIALRSLSGREQTDALQKLDEIAEAAKVLSQELFEAQLKLGRYAQEEPGEYEFGIDYDSSMDPTFLSVSVGIRYGVGRGPDEWFNGAFSDFVKHIKRKYPDVVDIEFEMLDLEPYEQELLLGMLENKGYHIV